MATEQPYAWRSARSRNSRNSTVEEMEERGRAPSYDQGGNIRGFRSRPGAPLSPRDSMSGKSMSANFGSGLTDANEWGSFFKGNSPTGVRLGYAASNPAIAAAATPLPASDLPVAAASSQSPLPAPSLLTDPTRSTSGGFLGSVIQNSMDFLKRSGISPSPTGQPVAAAPTVRPFKMYGSTWEDTKVPGVGTKRIVQTPYGRGASFFAT